MSNPSAAPPNLTPGPSSTLTPDSKVELKIPVFIQIILWMAPILFWTGFQYSKADEMKRDLEQVKASMNQHVALPNHPIAVEQTATIQAALKDIKQELQALRTQQEQQGRILSAICAKNSCQSP